jgi:hypothetical protein
LPVNSWQLATGYGLRAAGLLLGYGSVMIVQRVIERRTGKRTGWMVATIAASRSSSDTRRCTRSERSELHFRRA